MQLGTERNWLDLKIKRSKVKFTAMSKGTDCDVYCWVMHATDESREEAAFNGVWPARYCS